MWSRHQKPQVQPEARPAEPGTGFNYFRVRNVLFVNTPDVFLLFVFIFCCFRGCCCFSEALNKERAASSLSLFGKAQLEKRRIFLQLKPLGRQIMKTPLLRIPEVAAGCWVPATSHPCSARTSQLHRTTPARHGVLTLLFINQAHSGANVWLCLIFPIMSPF